MLNLDDIVSNNSSSESNDWPFRMIIIGPSGSGKTNTLLHLINKLHPIVKIYLYPKDTEGKFLIYKNFKFLISIFNKQKRTSWIKKLKWSSCIYRIFK